MTTNTAHTRNWSSIACERAGAARYATTAGRLTLIVTDLGSGNWSWRVTHKRVGDYMARTLFWGDSRGRFAAQRAAELAAARATH